MKVICFSFWNYFVYKKKNDIYCNREGHVNYIRKMYIVGRERSIPCQRHVYTKENLKLNLLS